MTSSPAPAPVQRMFAIDALKGFAITCVVMGHAILRNVADPSSDAVYLLLSAFEMPLFMFLSGFVLPRRVRGSLVVWVRKRAVRLMVPFLAWHAIFFLSRRIDALSDTSPAELVRGLARYLWVTVASPTAGLWYLPSLLLCSVALALLFRLREKPLVLATVGWVIFAGLAWGRSMLGIDADLGVLKTSTYWLFFAAGYAWGSWKRGLCLSPPLLRWAPALLYPLAAVPMMRVMPDLPAWANGAAKVALGLLGTGFSVVLLGIAEPVARWLRLDRLGRLTLGMYCSQWLFLRAEIATGVAGVLAAFAFTMVGSIAVTLLIGRVPGLKGVLLGEWPRRP